MFGTEHPPSGRGVEVAILAVGQGGLMSLHDLGTTRMVRGQTFCLGCSPVRSHLIHDDTFARVVVWRVDPGRGARYRSLINRW